MKNRDRHQPQPVHDYDIVIEPIADDGVTFQLRRYTDGIITMRQLVEELRYAKGLTIQYFFGLQEALTVELTQMLMENWGYSMQEALTVLYNSDTFERLSDPATGLYFQSAGYIYDYLQNELTSGKIS